MFKDSLTLIATLEAFPKRLQSMIFSPDGEFIATAGIYSGVQIWNISTGNQVSSLDFSGARIPQALVFTPDSKKIVSATEWYAAVEIWDVKSGQRISSLEEEDISTFNDRIGQNEIGYSCINFSHNGKMLGVGSTRGEDGLIQIWDYESEKLKLTWKAHESAVISIEFSPDSKLVASGGMDFSAKIWDASSGNLVHVLPHETRLPKYLSDIGVVFAPKGSYLVTSSIDYYKKPQLCFWDTSNWQKISVLHEHYSPVFSNDGLFLGTVNSDGSIVLWRTETLKQEYEFSKFTENEVFRIAFSPNGLLIASETKDDKGSLVRLWAMPERNNL